MTARKNNNRPGARDAVVASSNNELVNSSRRALCKTGCSSVLWGLPGLWFLTPSLAAAAPQDPRPEFASNQVSQVLTFFFGDNRAADDATIEIEAPLTSASRELVPFRIVAPGAEKLVVVSPTNTQPLIMAVDQIREPKAVIIGRARLEQTGEIVCYTLRNGVIGRASRRIALSGHWEGD